ncbi:uncharacterized protein Z518_10621 [Rhinocladiella mackenziei CBS 650.93]|uniref:GTP-binding protein ypt5 n=1 Tax=Rhinocladiella mackenziei CBS 650.93 TaxID=1442369 RepID=A0A0D2IB17_9EURO|nr:uncharacterized protein Z518_10621 [Rhinocladiella mackenziei CBS 650.93]KIX00481.1 hypothetical protein Z518_10621 [Rhinocladiella mackenziei CBS 650.93]
MAARAPAGRPGPGGRFAQFKLVLLGESAVGKSSLVLRFVKDHFDDYRESTIGAAFLTQTISLDENTTVKFEIWDTAGQERYKSLAPMYYRNANCAVVVYDVTQAVRFIRFFFFVVVIAEIIIANVVIQSSLDKAKSWVKELQRQANENIVIALAGNKVDVVNEHPDKRAIQTADAEAYAKEAGLLFFETSAKTSTNVRELFTAIAKKLPLDQAGPRSLRSNPRPGVDLRPESTGTQGAGNCQSSRRKEREGRGRGGKLDKDGFGDHNWIRRDIWKLNSRPGDPTTAGPDTLKTSIEKKHGDMIFVFVHVQDRLFVVYYPEGFFGEQSGGRRLLFIDTF